MHPIRSGLIALFAQLAVGSLVVAQTPALPTAEHGYLGIMVTPAQDGILVNEVTPDSPGANSGLKKGDRIVKFANNEVRDIDKFLQSVAVKKPGDKLALAVKRDGKEIELTLTVGRWPVVRNFAAPEAIDGPRRVLLGVQTENLTPELKKRLNVQADAGAVVTDVMPNSPAAKAGLKADDVITGVDKVSIASPTDLSNELQKVGSGKIAEIQAIRGNEKLTIKATLQSPSDAFSGPGVSPFQTAGAAFDPNVRIRDLERRIAELEKRLRDLEKK